MRLLNESRPGFLDYNPASAYNIGLLEMGSIGTRVLHI